MHELGITEEIVAIAARGSAGRPVARVVVEVGELAAVLPEAIRFCFDLCAEGTPVEGALLEIRRPPGLATCRVCGAEVVLHAPLGRCSCGSMDLEWIRGEELRVTAIEVK